MQSVPDTALHEVCWDKIIIFSDTGSYERPNA